MTGNFRTYGWLSHSHEPAELRISPFDAVDLIIWDSEDNSLLTAPGQKLVAIEGIKVSASGSIFVPYLGNQRIAGKTPEAARRQLEREMIQIVPSAQVQLNITPGSRSSVSLVSGVTAPGPVQLPEGHFTVLNLIAQGGGASTALRNPHVRLIRAGKTYRISMAKMLANPSLDSIVKGGDKVTVEADQRYFRALGASGTEELIYFEQDRVSALDAMSLIGGIQDARADPKGVLILREYGANAVRSDGSGPSNSRTVFTIDLTTADGLFSAGNFYIHPQDTVLVTESPVNNARTIFSLIGSTFGVANQINN
ncbi:polysaccharide biosynthesis/export family protein [Harenicola maris]